MDDYAGWLITWTTYGSCLPGDARGWRRRRSGPQAPSARLERWSHDRMRQEALLLRPGDRSVIEESCRQHCAFRGWELFAANARTNHVHVVVGGVEVTPRTVRDQLKANCTRALREENDSLAGRRIWTRGGDCVALPDEEALEAAIQYVVEGQGAQPN